mmetsp:Transcript_54536/g.61930  ORF Transcript_54536/g.61930 Transcript_54536/m.61930 type:complete len:85 (-) Transcript_54536:488-742(-)
MPVTIAPRPKTCRSALGDQTNTCVNISSNDNKNAYSTLPRKSFKPVLQVEEATATCTNKINTLVIQEDDTTHQPIKLKRVDVSL